MSKTRYRVPVEQAVCRPDVPVVRSQTMLDDSLVPISVRVVGQSDIDVHRHDFTELVVVFKGSGEHLLDDERFPIFAGDAFVIDQSHRHGYVNARGLLIANILFDESFLLARDPSLALLPGYQALVHLEPVARRKLSFAGKLRLTPQSRTTVEDKIDAMRTELNRKSDGYGAVALSLLVEIVVHLCRLYTSSESVTHRSLLDIGRVVSYLETNYDEDVQLCDLEQLVAMSTRTLIRRFGQATGTTPMQYLLRVRVTKATHLLMTARLSVTEIAETVGFNDSNYFARQFRKITGMSPRQYRRRQGGPSSHNIG